MCCQNQVSTPHESRYQRQDLFVTTQGMLSNFLKESEKSRSTRNHFNFEHAPPIAVDDERRPACSSSTVGSIRSLNLRSSHPLHNLPPPHLHQCSFLHIPTYSRHLRIFPFHGYLNDHCLLFVRNLCYLRSTSRLGLPCMRRPDSPCRSIDRILLWSDLEDTDFISFVKEAVVV